MTSPQDFYQWLKKSTIESPPQAVDQKIYQLTSKSAARPSIFSFSKYIILSTATVAAVILIFTTTQLKNIPNHPISESPELLAYYDQLELMNQTAQLSDREWDMVMQEGRP
jgi:hypothetical protein